MKIELVFKVLKAKDLQTQKTIVGTREVLIYCSKYKKTKKRTYKKLIHYDSSIMREPKKNEYINVVVVPRVSRRKSLLAKSIIQK